MNYTCTGVNYKKKSLKRSWLYFKPRFHSTLSSDSVLSIHCDTILPSVLHFNGEHYTFRKWGTHTHARTQTHGERDTLSFCLTHMHTNASLTFTMSVCTCLLHVQIRHWQIKTMLSMVLVNAECCLIKSNPGFYLGQRHALSSSPRITTSNRSRLGHFGTRQAPLKFSPHLVLPRWLLPLRQVSRGMCLFCKGVCVKQNPQEHQESECPTRILQNIPLIVRIIRLRCQRLSCCGYYACGSGITHSRIRSLFDDPRSLQKWALLQLFPLIFLSLSVV